VSREENRRLDTVLANRFFHDRSIRNRTLDEGPETHRPPVPGYEIVQRHWQKTRLSQHLRCMASDIAGAAGDKDGRFNS
jgi:hypothetical protein